MTLPFRPGPIALAVFGLLAAGAPAADPPLLSPPYRWTLSAPRIGPADRPADPCHAIKDPSVVFHDGKWHLFATIRSRTRTHQIEYLSFADWSKANAAERHVLTLTDGYFCAPQVFYFTPHKKWYLIYQVSDPARKPQLQPAFSTTTTLSDPRSWTKPTFLFDKDPEGVTAWIDFWVIGDATHARLFFTSLDGRLWRSDTKLADFPHGWGKPQVVLKADIFEASHTYKVKGRDAYFTFVEAQAGDRRYFKAYTAPRLDGEWKPLADTWDAPFAGLKNLPGDRPWTASVSHGELLRAGTDERLEVDPADVKLVFQGVSDADRAGKRYGDIPWRLGLLELVSRK
jgi:Glycosyl hydrolase family 62